jgi:hypothetical protein
MAAEYEPSLHDSEPPSKGWSPWAIYAVGFVAWGAFLFQIVSFVRMLMR